MSDTTKSLAELVQEVPADMEGEVRDFVEFLLAKRAYTKHHILRQDWAGSLRDLRDHYTSLELQQHALDWRGD